MAALDLLGRRGTLRLLWELRSGNALTFRELAAAAELQPATLNTRLRELREAQLVETERGYRLSSLGLELLGSLAPLQGWATRWARGLGD
jgi:DNA-binding HxlR family transcriptional regulator